MTATIALAEAKASLSAVVRNVGSNGAEYIVTVRGEPLAMIVPVPKKPPKELEGFGALAGLRQPATREDEKRAWAEAMEAKHGAAAGR